ncbi:nucleoside triphosphate pyrophosphohydrolase [Candidatus Parcubacteria bacterium]|nr:nucleoside triphosphate pyrophosphohydrolase [Candidatus Parcubacteria bacterium]
MLHYNKLIRDKVPQVAKRKGITIKYRTADADEEFWFLLKNKLQEEVTELGSDADMEAIVDIMEVIDTMIEFKKFDRKMLQAVRENKTIEQGKFSNRLVLEESDQEIGHEQSQLV